MASQQMPKLSLIAQYDDLCRHTKSLTEGCEKEFKQFIETQKKILVKRKQAELEIVELRRKVDGFKQEKERYEAKLEYLKNSIRSEIQKRKQLETEKASMERQIELIKEVLLNDGNTIDKKTKERFLLLSSTYKQQGGSPTKLTTIEESVGSLLSASEYDQSDEEMDIGVTHRKRRSKGRRSFTDFTQKKRKSEEKINGLSTDDDDFGFNDVKLTTTTNLLNFRSSSDSTCTTPEPATLRPIFRSESGQRKELRRYNTLGSTPVGNIGYKQNQSHEFQAKTVMKGVEKCFVCGNKITFLKQVLKCNKCRMTCHIDCKAKCPQYCIYAVSTPTKATGTISDYTPTNPPMIPPLIVHCVKEIESRGSNVIGLYRQSGMANEVKSLMDTFLKGKSVPSLVEADVHAICGTIKLFLKSLKDSLITRDAWKTFVDAASCIDENESINLIFNAVTDLPQSNRDTLAFLILHFQRIAASPECKMTISNLAKVLGPTIVGYSNSEPANSMSKEFHETECQQKVMQKLLMVPADSWQSLLGNDDNDPFYTPMRTPECTPAPVTSRLGPIITSGQKSKNATPVTRTPLKPRVTRTGSKNKRQFFSPLLK